VIALGALVLVIPFYAGVLAHRFFKPESRLGQFFAYCACNRLMFVLITGLAALFGALLLSWLLPAVEISDRPKWRRIGTIVVALVGSSVALNVLRSLVEEFDF
jgi:uncharacterized membrane protein YeaQ/YmgE (transglycosylase-associated protein family)